MLLPFRPDQVLGKTKAKTLYMNIKELDAALFVYFSFHIGRLFRFYGTNVDLPMIKKQRYSIREI